MEYLKFSKLTENDFNKIIYEAGGFRYTDKYEEKDGERNCDYILDDAVIELKIIDENPTDKIKNKEEKLSKLAQLFGSETKTVIMYPTDDKKYEYYNILSTPFKSNLKSASKQLRQSSERLNKKHKIAIIMNQGLTMTSHKEFEEIAIKRAKNNDASGIDILIVCGVYYFSDKFDMRVFTNFEDFHIRGEECKEIINKLRIAWNKKTTDYMTQQIIDPNLKRTKEPIQDLFFELNGIRYVKPPIQWDEPSNFYGENRRPREDSSENKECNPVSYILPIFDDEAYLYCQNHLLEKEILKNSNSDYLKWAKKEQQSLKNIYQPISLVEVVKKDLENLKIPFSINQLQDVANKNFEKKFENIYNNLIEYNNETKHNRLIFVEVQEIGMDKANDIAFISYAIFDEKSNTMKQHQFISGERIKYKCALLLGVSYCIALNAEAVYFMRNEDFKWK